MLPPPRHNGHDGDSARSDLPIVVGGCHRSGTTLVRRILDSHSRISCGPELKFLIDFHDGYTREDPLRHERFSSTARSHVPEAEAFSILGAAFIKLHERRARRQRKPRWADKNPENVHYLDSWRRLLGHDWLFVNVVRDLRDVLASMEEAEFPFDGENRDRDRIEHYEEYVRSAERFEAENPERSLTVSYEELVAHPDKEIERLMTWLGEESEASQLVLESSGADGLGDPKAGQAEPFALESIGRWREDLTQGQIEAAQQTMRRIRRDG